MSEGTTTRCRFCGKLYVLYSHYVGDQSACGGCVAAARGFIQPWVVPVGFPVGVGDTATKPCPHCDGSGRVKQ